MGKGWQVTDRTIEETERQFGFDLVKESEGWIEDPTILVSGSGTSGKLEGGLKRLRPDAVTISLDPSLSFDEDSEGLGTQEIIDLANGETLIYQDKIDRIYTGRRPLNPKDGVKLHRARILRHESDFPVAGVAEDIPLKDNSIDVVIDVLGPSHYLRGQKEEVIKYYRELERVVNGSGIVYLYECDVDQIELITRTTSFRVESRALSESLASPYFIAKLVKGTSP